MKRTPITVRASADLVSKIDDVARDLGSKTVQRVSRGAVIRAACEEYVTRHSSRATRCTASARPT